MSLSLAIALNIIADMGLIGGLAYVMSRPARLQRHTQQGAQVIELQTRGSRPEQERRAA